MIVVTGASGFVGRQLVDRLRQKTGVPLLLVSRDPAALANRFPDDAVTDYAGLAFRDLTDAVVVHLAIRNNDTGGDAGDFFATNVDHLLQTARAVRAAGAARFVNFCSTHALSPRPEDHYGQSKRDGASSLVAMWPDATTNLYLPAIYGAHFQGRLAFINRLPRSLRPAILAVSRQIRPMVSVDRVADWLAHSLVEQPTAYEDSWQSEVYLADAVAASGIYAIGRRILDLLTVVGVTIFLGWAMAIIALLIRLDSKGPAIFAQSRVGQHGCQFTCYKFRTMSLGTRQAATHEVSATSVTRLGAYLRRSKLDELPQIANLLLNEMTLVGPRPCLPVQTDLIALRKQRGVLDLKPGITGLAQIHDIDMSDPARLAAWDGRYGAFRTLALDCTILLRTALGGGAGDRVTTVTSSSVS